MICITQRAQRVIHVISDTLVCDQQTIPSERVASRTNITPSGSGFSEDILGKTRYRILVLTLQTPTFSGSTFTLPHELYQRELLLSWDTQERSISHFFYFCLVVSRAGQDQANVIACTKLCFSMDNHGHIHASSNR